MIKDTVPAILQSPSTPIPSKFKRIQLLESLSESLSERFLSSSLRRGIKYYAFICKKCYHCHNINCICMILNFFHKYRSIDVQCFLGKIKEWTINQRSRKRQNFSHRLNQLNSSRILFARTNEFLLKYTSSNSSFFFFKNIETTNYNVSKIDFNISRERLKSGNR